MTVVALALPVLIAATALAVDVGFQRVDRREMQKVADVVSLDLARQISVLGTNRGQILNADLDADGLKDWSEAIVASADRNGHDIGLPVPVCPAEGVELSANCLTVTLGVWDNSGFTACKDVPAWAADPAQCVPDAVHVLAGGPTDYVVRPGSGSSRRQAVAAIGDLEQASFRLGSSLAAINPQSNTMIGQILNSLTGGDARVLAYDGLVNADVGLDALGVALGIPITAMSPQELANTQVTVQQLTVAAAQALSASGGDAADVALLNDFIALGVTDAQVNLADVFGVDTTNTTTPALVGEVNLVNVLTAAAFVVTGDHFLDVPGAVVGIPGITDVQIRLTAIEAPVTVTGGDGASGTTSQVHVEIVPTFDLNSSTVAQRLCTLPANEQSIITSLLSGVLNLLGCLLAPLQTFPLGVNITGQPTIGLDLAEVTGTQDIDCGPQDRFTVTTSPSIVDLTADVDLALAATLSGVVTTQLARLHIPAGATTNGGAGSATFTGLNPVALPTGVEYFDFTPASAQVGAVPVGLANTLTVGPTTVTALGGVDLSTIANNVVALAQPILNNVLAELDSYIVQPLVQMLGLHLGGSHITPLWLRCDQSAVTLVQ